MKKLLFILFLLNTINCAHSRTDIQVNFVFASSNQRAQIFDNKNQMDKELKILNRYFVDENNNPLFNFKFGTYTNWSAFVKKGCVLAKQLNQEKNLDINQLKKNVNNCFKIKRGEVYFIIYDAYNHVNGWKDATGWGFNNAGKRFILIDWMRLNYKHQAPSPHEMGHAFGLEHVCVPNAKFKDATNIMASSSCGKGSGGQRNIGFSPQQVQTIYQNLYN